MSDKSRPAVSKYFLSAVVLIVPLGLALGFLAFVWIDRREVFQRLSQAVLDGDNWLPYAWGLVAIVLLAIQVRRIGRWRSLWVLRTLLLAITIGVTLILVIGKSASARYQVYRWECFHQHWGVTALNVDETEDELVLLLAEPAIGSCLHRDDEMLTHLAFTRPDLFARRPCEATLALRSILRYGVGPDQIQSSIKGQTFLLYALAGDVYFDSENPFDWLAYAGSNQAIEGQSILPPNVIQDLLSSRIETLGALSVDELESLVFCVAHFPAAVDSDQRQQVRDAWQQRVPEFSSLLGEGFALGERLNALLAESQSSGVRFAWHEGHLLPVDASRRQVAIALPRALETLLQLTVDSFVDDTVDAGSDGAAEFKLSVDGEVLYRYQQQVLRWTERYKPGGIRTSWGRRGQYRPGRLVTELEPTGETRTVARYGATIKLEAASGAEPFETSATLVYWQDYLLDPEDDSELESASYENLSGRIWPLGIHESYFRGSTAFTQGDFH